MFAAFVILEKFPKHHPAIVAFGTLLALILLGYVPAEKAFTGFSNRAVITVVLTLFCGQALEDAGVIDAIGYLLKRIGKSSKIVIFAIFVSCLISSGLMNNITAMYIFLPIGKRICREYKIPTGYFVMPLAFCSLLGGMLTKMGTPPNMVIAQKRHDLLGIDCGLLYDTPLAIVVVTISMIVLYLLAHKMLPAKGLIYQGDYNRNDYLFAFRIKSNLNKTFSNIFTSTGPNRPTCRMVIIKKVNYKVETAAAAGVTLRKGDIIVVKCIDPDEAKTLSAKLDAEILGLEELEHRDLLHTITIDDDSTLIGQSPEDKSVSSIFNVSFLAFARNGIIQFVDVGSHKIEANTYYLVLGAKESVEKFTKKEDLPSEIPEGAFHFKKWKIATSTSIFVAAIGISNFGIAPLEICLLTTFFINCVTGILQAKPREIVNILLMGALVALMIPIGETIETTGAAKVLAESMVSITSYLPMTPELSALLGILLASIIIANFIDNTAAAQMMLPIAISTAKILGVSPDPYFAVIMIGVSTTFMLPIAHNCTILAQRECGYSIWDFMKYGGIITLVVIVVTMATVPLLYQF